MKISELSSGQGKVELDLEVKSLGEAREFEKYGKTLRVSSATVSDGEGDIILSLWNDDIDKVKVGDKIKVENGYVSEFQGKLQLSAGKFGKIIFAENGGDKKEEAPAEAKEESPESQEVKEEEEGEAAI
jgi:replication factor A1